MARMHSRDKGKSGSTRPIDTKRSWIRYKAKEAEMLVLKLAKEGLSTSEIGITLRDTYGIPDAKEILGKKITQLLQEKDLTKDIPEDVMALMRRAVKIKKHLEGNKHDETAKRGLTLTESKIKRLVKYYKKTNKLPTDWKYNPDQLILTIE